MCIASIESCGLLNIPIVRNFERVCTVLQLVPSGICNSGDKNVVVYLKSTFGGRNIVVYVKSIVRAMLIVVYLKSAADGENVVVYLKSIFRAGHIVVYLKSGLPRKKNKNNDKMKTALV